MRLAQSDLGPKQIGSAGPNASSLWLITYNHRKHKEYHKILACMFIESIHACIFTLALFLNLVSRVSSRFFGPQTWSITLLPILNPSTHLGFPCSFCIFSMLIRSVCFHRYFGVSALQSVGERKSKTAYVLGGSIMAMNSLTGDPWSFHTYKYIHINTGWWFQPLWKILVNWDDYFQ